MGHSGEEGEKMEQIRTLVDLRKPKQPVVIHKQTLYERWPEPSDRSRRPPGRVGRRMEGLLLGRERKEIVMTLTDRDIDSHYSQSLRPEPVSTRYHWVGDRFQPLRLPDPGLGGCH